MKIGKLITKIILMSIMILSAVSCVNLIDPYNGWDGSIKEPENDGRNYIIKTPEELAWIMEKVNSGDDFIGNTVKIESNISFNGREIAGIATGSLTKLFNGTIDGGGYTISSFTINKSTNSYIGFVGQLGAGGKITNLIINGKSIKGSSYVGGIVGLNKGQIISCMSKTDVSGYKYIGGISGRNDTTGDIVTSVNKNNVTASDNYVGGITGENLKKIENCYNTAEVTGQRFVGGIAGINKDSTASVKYSFSSSSKVTGTSDVGGLIGYNDGGVLTSNYFLKDIGIDVPSSVESGVQIVTIIQKSIQSTFSGWDFANTWKMAAMGPQLRWEK